MKYVNWEKETGYHIVSHPLCKQKKFVTVHSNDHKLIDKKKIEAFEFLNNLNEQLKCKNM